MVGNYNDLSTKTVWLFTNLLYLLLKPIHILVMLCDVFVNTPVMDPPEILDFTFDDLPRFRLDPRPKCAAKHVDIWIILNVVASPMQHHKSSRETRFLFKAAGIVNTLVVGNAKEFMIAQH